MTGSQNTCRGPDLESVVCRQVKLDMRGFRAFPWKQMAQVGLHDPPVERQLHMTVWERKKWIFKALRCRGSRSKEARCKDLTAVLRKSPGRTPRHQVRFECVRVVSDDEVFLLRCVRVARAEPDKVLSSEIPCLSQQGKLRVLRRRYEFNCNELSLTWGNTNKHTHTQRDQVGLTINHCFYRFFFFLR